MHRSLAIALLLGALIGCGGDDTPASRDAAPLDASTAADADVQDRDASVQLGWVDFAVIGCTSGEGSEASPCIGPSPLRLRFALLTPAAVDSQSWFFGDGSEPDLSLNPEHVFAAPGSYDVSLNAEGPGGTAGVTRLAAVVVIPAPLAASCTSDSHCASGDCACELADSCPDVLGGGMCVRSCASHAACGGNRCVNLDPTGNGSEDWERTTCLPACTPQSDSCGPNRSCEALLGVDGLITHACFASGLLRPLGASCRDVDGQLSDALCASGLCLDLGDRGMCSFSCQSLACPSGSACATFVSGVPAGPHCLVDCSQNSCDADGSLACENAGTAFTVTGAASAAGYCAPIP